MTSPDIVHQAIEAARAGRKTDAREMLLQVVESDPYNELAWIWLSGLVDALEDRIVACENALTINPSNEKVKAYLAELYQLRTAEQEEIPPVQVSRPQAAPTANPPVQKDLLAEAVRLEQDGRFDEALDLYKLQATTVKDSRKFDEIYKQIIRIEALQKENIRYVSPMLSILRLTFTWPLMYFLFVLLHAGFNPFAHLGLPARRRARVGAAGRRGRPAHRAAPVHTAGRQVRGPRPGGACWPVDYWIEYTTNSVTWATVPGMAFTNQPPPAGTLTLTFSNAIIARGLRLYATKLRPDEFGNYYLQIAEFKALGAEPWAYPSELRGKKVINAGQFSTLNLNDAGAPTPSYLANNPDYLANHPFDGVTIPIKIDTQWTTNQGLFSDQRKWTVARYLIVIEKAAGNFSAYSPDLPGCVATGRTRAAAEKNMKKAIEMHIRSLKRDNLPLPESRSSAEYVNIR